MKPPSTVASPAVAGVSLRSNPEPAGPKGLIVDAFGGRYHLITDSDHLPTFFMNIVSSSNLWLFVASNGGLTAGRCDAEQALLPYQTVDRIYDSAGQQGSFTAVWVNRDSGPVLWEPFGRRTGAGGEISRALYKSVEGDRLWFEETNTSLGLVFRYGWSTSDEHGFLRRAEIENLSGEPVDLRVLDGLRNLLPPGIAVRMQSLSSCLADAYKTAELLPTSNLAVFALQAGIVDRAIALEALRASVAWSEGLPEPTILLSESQIGLFLEGGTPAPEERKRGVRASYLAHSSFTLPAMSKLRWLLVADIGLSQAEVAARQSLAVRGKLAAAALAGADASTAKLRQLVAAADGLQLGGEESTTAHHFTNVLFNIMRGGVFADGHNVPAQDFAAFVAIRNRPTAQRHERLLASLPDALPRAELLATLASTGDPDLERLGYEYLPLTFSRRHGDPSRPWNRFSIRLRDAQGNRLLNYEGNWRDIFQNWEALCLSHPEFLQHIVAKFLNGSTIDGYNPYRLTHVGLDWEVPETEDPWASIGYWGDHQVIYLLKLCEWLGQFHPGRLESWLRRNLFAYADVPYRIADYQTTRRNPRATIQFEEIRHREILARIARTGSDARLLRQTDGSVHHTNLTEKLLVMVLTRLTNFVPGGGIWMNTQRPEWNDANNALVGYGVSVVTLAYLRRALVHIQRDLLPALGSEPVPVSGAVATLLRRIQEALTAHRPTLGKTANDGGARRAMLDALATAGSDYRTKVYADGPGAPEPVTPEAIRELFATALVFIDLTLRANRRDDGLYHSYNLLEFAENPRGLNLKRLGLMLEGQVAILSSGLLSPEEATALLDALRVSPLFRADQNSYLLYPDRDLPGFLSRNVIPPALVQTSRLLQELLAGGDQRLVLRDADGQVRFHADLANEEALLPRLDELARHPRWAALVAAEKAAVHEIYEAVFHHRMFTGRSGSMFGYEGLGCIYWHMVAKLLLAVQENVHAAADASPAAARRLVAHYYDIRSGLGFNKSPSEYGAFPTDPYSHTPGHSGAQQPGMTGQVKEEILTRLGELGVTVDLGRVSFAPTLLRASEFTTEPARFHALDVSGQPVSLPLPSGSLAFTFCGTPVAYHRTAGAARVVVHTSRGEEIAFPGSVLDESTSAQLFSRRGEIASVTVELGADYRPLTNYGPAKGSASPSTDSCQSG